MNEQPAIETSDLCKQYGTVGAVRNLSIQVTRGTIHGFLGPNGSGKTTTIRMLSGLLKPSSGRIAVLGHSIPDHAEQLRSRLGYMTQRFSLYDDLTVAENLRFVGEIHTMTPYDLRKRTAELIEHFDLARCGNTRVGNLSGGERQRLALAAATMHEPEILYLDEPTSAIDPQSRRDFWDLLFRLSHAGATVMISTHYMDEACRCHQLGILAGGQLVAAGSPGQLIRDLDAHVVNVAAPRIEAAKSTLASVDDIISVTQIGSDLRVLVNRSRTDPVRWVSQFLEPGRGHRVDPVQANLEDVFVVATAGST